MKAYTSIWRLRFINGMQYRSAALAGMATQLFFGFVFIMIFAAFYSNSTGTQPISLEDLITYVWLQQIFLSFIMLWFRDQELFDLITNGNIAYELCRPMALYPHWYSKLLAQRFASATLRCFPLLAIVFVIPEPYRMGLPPTWGSFLLFLVALALGLLVVVAISMLIYISVFWTMSPVGSILMIAVAGEFLAGMVIPVPLMPSWLQPIVYILPFRWTTDFPFRVYSGHIPIAEAAWGLLIQLAWLAVLVLAGKALMKKALRAVVVQGG
ncbi:ABC transporter permease [Paenibacillus sp. 1011MAR3C5]|uniref:ABC transporter permease n=1 Tax=Paenibacillus sp. 1011MAR3C5 TaxID=1675787 RepID=UPI000E6CAD1B|nr:ABC-2 family transporter protein [Paenibacillus sp. 1011MAR3C5]RJE91204.1 ABC transporter permease [Paenibacillus sp. 1011MAR3C5]